MLLIIDITLMCNKKTNLIYDNIDINNIDIKYICLIIKITVEF